MIQILIIDDDADCAEALADTLQDVGYDVAMAGSAAAALRRLQSERPSLIVLDLLMPGMSGEEFLARRRADPALADIPVIVLTATPAAFNDPDGQTPVLRKPVDPAELLDLVASMTTT